MTQTTLQEIFTEWQNNLTFRKDFKKNPELALKNAGFEVSQEDMQKIQSLVKIKESEALDKRDQR
jgi:hypothetical protein